MINVLKECEKTELIIQWQYCYTHPLRNRSITMFQSTKKMMLLLSVMIFIVGCGQTGPLFIAQSEAEHNDGHFMTKYKAPKDQKNED